MPSLANRRRRNRNHPVQQDKKSSICDPLHLVYHGRETYSISIEEAD